jgi:hypothetical protein
MIDEPLAECVHHWVIDGEKKVRLPRDRQLQHPNCIGRRSRCKKCGRECVQLEKVWDINWSEE